MVVVCAVRWVFGWFSLVGKQADTAKLPYKQKNQQQQGKPTE
jgi:hypothetical protein